MAQYIDLTQTLQKRISEINKNFNKYRNSTGNLSELEILLPINVIEDLDLDNGDLKSIINIKKAKTKLNSIQEVSNIAYQIANSLGGKSVGALHEWVDFLKNIHWRVTDRLGNISYFKPISEEIGLNTIGKTYDTQTIGILNPRDIYSKRNPKTPAAYYRTNLKSKLFSSSAAARIQDDYNTINWLFARQLNFYIAPDQKYKDELDKKVNGIKNIIENQLDGAIKLIKYLYPIEGEVFIAPTKGEGPLETTITTFRYGLNLLELGPIPRPNTSDEKVRPNVIINFRGDKKPEIIEKKINNSVIEPIIDEPKE